MPRPALALPRLAALSLVAPRRLSDVPGCRLQGAGFQPSDNTMHKIRAATNEILCEAYADTMVGPPQLCPAPCWTRPHVATVNTALATLPFL